MTDAEPETPQEECEAIVREAIRNWAGTFLAPVVIKSLAREIVDKLEAAEFL